MESMNQKPGFETLVIFMPVWIKTSVVDALIPSSFQIWIQKFVGANL